MSYGKQFIQSVVDSNKVSFEQHLKLINVFGFTSDRWTQQASVFMCTYITKRPLQSLRPACGPHGADFDMTPNTGPVIEVAMLLVAVPPPWTWSYKSVHESFCFFSVRYISAMSLSSFMRCSISSQTWFFFLNCYFSRTLVNGP